MRDIKFECIVLGNKKEVIARFNEWLDGDGWKHDYYAPLVTNGVFSHEELGDGWFGEIIRMQYCGLKDKAGKEIYESDIDQDGGRIFYNESIAAFQIDYGGDVDIADMEDVDKWMVVSGNIYESPELLNPLNKQS